MRHIMLFPFLTVAVICTAQPVLYSNEMQAPGETTYMLFLGNMNAVDTTIQGENMVWDFTGMMPEPGAPPFIATIIEPDSTPYGSSFPTSNIAWWEQPNNWYRYFNLTNDFMERVGSHVTSDFVYGDPQVEYVFPLTYGTTNIDQWVGVTDQGLYKLNCIGYGTLHVPGATLEDVLMVRARISGNFYVLNAYFWYSSTDGRILLQYINSPLLSEAIYYDGAMMAVHERTPFKAALLGNPVSERLNFTLGVDAQRSNYHLISSTGAIVDEGRISARAGEIISLDVQQHMPGLYMLQLRDASGAAETIKYLKH